MVYLIGVILMVVFVLPFIIKMSILAWAFVTFAPDVVETLKNLLLQICNT